MTALAALLLLGAVTWVYRITFTALVSADRLPAVVRSRTDAVGTAAFAALVATHVAGADPVARPATVAAVVAAALVARLTRSHLAPVLVAFLVWLAVSAW